MGTGMVTLIVGAVALIVVVLIYNKLIRLRNRFLNAFSQIEVQLQRRYELIPNLVETASAYMKHESDTLMAVTQARNTASDRCSEAAKDPQDASLVGALASAEGALSNAMGRLNVVMENYPDLKADAQMRDFSEELASTENRVAFSRQAYSDAVMTFNTAREQFPAVLVATACAFKEADLFEAEDPAMKQPVKVSFA
jgi:LemA protein